MNHAVEDIRPCSRSISVRFFSELNRERGTLTSFT
jgi:hypothetical protein